MRQSLAVLLMLPIAASILLYNTAASAADYPPDPYTVYDDSAVLFSPEQLDNLVAPVALYPDPLLAQVVVAATFPEQIDEAARFLRAGANPGVIDTQPWDVSIKAVAHYPTVLYMMADNLDWTASLGQAYVYQSTDVMTAVQRLRIQARAAGHLRTTPQLQVVEEGGYVEIWPAHPQALYVPVYDPALVFHHHAGYRPSTVLSFSVGFPIGAWLNYDVDWHRHRVYYHGWKSKRGWVHRYRPHVRVSNLYVNQRYTDVRVNRTVVHRRVNYRALDRYNKVHRRVRYDTIRSRLHDIERRERRDIRRERGVPGGRRRFDANDRGFAPDRARHFERRPDRRGPAREVHPVPRRRQPGTHVNRPVNRQQNRQIQRQPDRRGPTREVRPSPERRQFRPRREVRPPEQRQPDKQVNRPVNQQRNRRIQQRPDRRGPTREVRPTREQRQFSPRREVRPTRGRRQPETQADRLTNRQRNRQIQRRERSELRDHRARFDPRAARQRGQVRRHRGRRSESTVRSPAQRRSSSHHRGNASDRRGR